MWGQVRPEDSLGGLSYTIPDRLSITHVLPWTVAFMSPGINHPHLSRNGYHLPEELHRQTSYIIIQKMSVACLLQ